MSKVTMETTDLAGVLSQAQQEELAAAEAERIAAEARQRAETARIEAEQRQRQARERWAEGVLAAYDDRRRSSYAALTAAEAVWQASPAEPAMILPAWMERERARATLFGIELEREKAAGILGHSPRSAKVPRADLAGDLTALLGNWALEQVSAVEEAVNESLSAATTGREARA